MKTQRGLALLTAAIVVASAIAPTAHAVENNLNGSTAWGPCTWSTSNNIRYTSSANKAVKVKLNTVGPLGVKMRAVRVSNSAESATRYYPPTSSWQTLVTYSAKDTAFRLQFSCTNPRTSGTSPSTDFAGKIEA